MESDAIEAATEEAPVVPYKSNVVAAVWSLVFPPAGLWCKRRYVAGLVWLVALSVG